MGKRRDRIDYLICAFLIVVTLAIYLQVRGFGFVNLDDGAYVQNNRHVLGGVSLSSIKWASSTYYQANWHPLTWISLMLDAQIGGGKPGVFHLTNVLFHILNTLLLFVFLRRATGFRWQSAVVAALFALHPLHVESVAWIAERKDVLSTFFWLLTMIAYVEYAKRPRTRGYMLVVLAFGLGLMAKPMLVSLPIMLLLIDLWPLRRIELGSNGLRLWSLVREKILLFAMAAGLCVVTFWAQSAGGAVASVDLLPFGVRAANALVACVSYIIKMVCPLNLVAMYPHPTNQLPVWQVVGSGLFISAVTVVAIKSARRRPWLTVGWLWWLVTLVPVIGLVQVGQQAMADRYTYVPLIGLFIIIAWGVPELLGKLCETDGQRKGPSLAWSVLGGVLLAGLIATTHFQIGYWRDSISLYGHVLTIDENNFPVRMWYADALGASDRYEEAVKQYSLALKQSPGDGIAHHHLALVLAQMGRVREAIEQDEMALAARPDDPGVHNSLGVVLARTGRTDEAIQHFTQAIAIDPDDPAVHNNLASALEKKGDYKAAIRQFRTALRLAPTNRRVRARLARAKAGLAHYER